MHGRRDASNGAERKDEKFDSSTVRFSLDRFNYCRVLSQLRSRFEISDLFPPGGGVAPSSSPMHIFNSPIFLLFAVPPPHPRGYRLWSLSFLFFPLFLPFNPLRRNRALHVSGMMRTTSRVLRTPLGIQEEKNVYPRAWIASEQTILQYARRFGVHARFERLIERMSLRILELGRVKTNTWDLNTKQSSAK